MIIYSRKAPLTLESLAVARDLADLLLPGEGASCEGHTVYCVAPDVFNVSKDAIDSPDCRFTIEKGR